MYSRSNENVSYKNWLWFNGSRYRGYTQTDLPKGTPSGLSDAVKILDGQKDIAFHYFHADDVVRHNLVQKIIEAYERKIDAS